MFHRVFLLASIVAVVASTSVSAEEIEPTFAKTVRPFLTKHCLSCHGDESPEADLSLTKLSEDPQIANAPATWKKVAERIVLGEMPPEDETRPDARDASNLVGWVKQQLSAAGEDVSDIGSKLLLPGHGNRVDHEALFAGEISTPAASPPRVWRIRPQIYASYVPSISKNAKVGQPFSSSSAAGFKDYADLFVVDEPTINQLFRNANQIVAIQCGSLRQSKPLKEFETLLAVASSPDDRGPAMEAAIRKQFQNAVFRNPTDEELERFTQLMEKSISDAGPEVGVKTTLAAVLMLPEAMYRYELGQSEADEFGRVMLAPRELAFAIAFALTDEAPDKELLAAAEKGELSTAAEVREQVGRILADDRIDKPQIMRFFEQYFEFTTAEDVFKDLPRGKWRPEVLVNDARLLIEHTLDEDQEVLKRLLTTNKYFVNCRVDPKQGLVESRVFKNETKRDKSTGKIIPRDPIKQIAIHDFYSLPEDWQWTKKQPVEFPQEERAGILTHPSWLAGFASNNENHAIQRGKWIRERLLGGVVPDLPISVDAKLPDAPEQSLRQRMEITEQSYCWQCHQKMNPLGLMFENYDYLGRYRKVEPVLDPEATAENVNSKGEPQGDVLREIPVDAHGVVSRSGDKKIDGDYDNGIAMIHALADSPRVRQVFVRHAFRFWMGRNETLADAPTLLAADKAYAESNGSMKALITSLLSSDSFLYRRTP